MRNTRKNSRKPAVNVPMLDDNKSRIVSRFPGSFRYSRKSRVVPDHHAIKAKVVESNAQLPCGVVEDLREPVHQSLDLFEDARRDYQDDEGDAEEECKEPDHRPNDPRNPSIRKPAHHRIQDKDNHNRKQEWRKNDATMAERPEGSGRQNQNSNNRPRKDTETPDNRPNVLIGGFPCAVVFVTHSVDCTGWRTGQRDRGPLCAYRLAPTAPATPSWLARLARPPSREDRKRGTVPDLSASAGR